MRPLLIIILATLCLNSCSRKRDAMCRCCAAWGDCADYHLIQNKTATEAREICNTYTTSTLFCDINKTKE